MKLVPTEVGRKKILCQEVGVGLRGLETQHWDCVF